MHRGKKNYLTKQTGEYLVAAELCRRGFVATTFSGNLPEFDIIATDGSGKSIPIQVKTARKHSWHLDAGRYLRIQIKRDAQITKGRLRLASPNIICVFLKLGNLGNDAFYILRISELQEILEKEYKGRKRPKNIRSTHFAIYPHHLAEFKDRWDLIGR